MEKVNSPLVWEGGGGGRGDVPGGGGGGGGGGLPGGGNLRRLSKNTKHVKSKLA